MLLAKTLVVCGMVMMLLQVTWVHGSHRSRSEDLYCAGYQYWWRAYSTTENCGTCGDPYNGGHRFYHEGQVITVKAMRPQNNRPWLEFRLCPLINSTELATQDCFDQYVLRRPGTTLTRHQIFGGSGSIDIKLELPDGVSCRHCVMQWQSGTGTTSFTGDLERPSCRGCTLPQLFRGCSVFSIFSTEARGTVCQSAGAYEGQPGMDEWCTTNCAAGFCPETHCACT